MRPGPAPAAQNAAVLQQGLAVYAQLDDARYTAVPEGLAHNGVGSHFRHIHDYYRCFLRGIADGRIDYDRRLRDERFEVDRTYAARELAHTLGELLALEPRDAERPVWVKMDAEDGGEGLTAEQLWSRSTLGRELRFLLSHTIHHYALIAMILKVQGFDCGREFGVAPSTLEYWKAGAVCAPSPGSDA